MKHAMPEYRQGDRITVFLTEMAESSNWITRDYTEKELSGMTSRGIRIQPGEKKIGLKQRLEENYGQARIEGIRIPEGRNREELDQIFEAMYAVIEPGETIIFDFTHGLRNIPMQALTIIHYAKALKHISIGGMFYGAFETFQFYYKKMCQEEKPLSEVALQRLFENICRDVEIFGQRLVCRRGKEPFYLDDTATGIAAELKNGKFKPAYLGI